MNLLLADSDQVLHSGGWLDRLEIDRVSVGNEMSDAEIAKLSTAINVKALAGLSAGGGQTHPIDCAAINPAILWKPPTPDRLQRLFDEGAVIDRTSVAARLLGRASGRQSPPDAGQPPLPGAPQRDRADAI